MLGKLVNNYSYQITEKQNQYLRELGADNTNDIKNHKQISKIIRNKQSEWKLSHKQREHIIQLATLNQLKQILNRDVIYIDQITYTDYLRIKTVLQDIDKFYVNTHDHILKIGPGYEYGWQPSEKCSDNKMYYMRFYDLFMIDIDGKTLENLKNIYLAITTLDVTARIYETYNGYHVFITSDFINHTECEPVGRTFKDADPFYIAYSHKIGYKIRLSMKKDRDEKYIAKYLTVCGNKVENVELLSLLKIHDSYLKD